MNRRSSLRTGTYLYACMPVTLYHIESCLNGMMHNAYEIYFGRVRVGLTCDKSAFSASNVWVFIS